MINSTIQVFELQMGEDWTEVNMISFVDDPAIKTPFLNFKNQDPFKFSTLEEKRIVTGPVLIPDIIIPRRINDTVFHVVFKADQIKKVYDKFMQSKSYANSNFMHSKALNEKDDCHVFECFLTDPDRGIHPPEAFKDMPPYTWFMSYKVTGDPLWKMIKEKKINGFSIEGHFRLVPQGGTDDEAAAILQQLEEVNELVKNS